MSSRTVLVDLDGTLTDPADGILGGFEFALRRLGATVPPRSDLRWVIGPPLRQAFPRLLPDPQTEHVEAAVEAYREYYRGTGIFEATVYRGIPAALERLREAGYRLILCTAKPTVFACPVVEHFGLAGYLDSVYGAELDGRFDDKGELIGHILADRGLAPAEMVMIGDRGSDIAAARRNAMAAVGVTWGYGSKEELQDSGAAALCDEPLELPAAVEVLLRR